MIIDLRMNSSFSGALPRADTLFGAICWAISWTQGEKTLCNLLERFSSGDPPFLLSSLFPYVGRGKKTVRFLPRPVLPPPALTVECLRDADAVSAYKRLRWVTVPIFQRITAGDLAEEEILEWLMHGENPEAKRNSVWAREALLDEGSSEELNALPEEMSLWRSTESPHASIDRISGTVSEGRFFYTQETHPPRNGGFYFLVRLRAPECRSPILSALAFLSEKGIGGDASVGKGAFSFEVSDDELFAEPARPSHFITLSPFHPSERDLDFLSSRWEDACYTLWKKKGKLESMYVDAPDGDLWKDTVLYFAEGSTFPWNPATDLYGWNPIVKTRPFKVQQYGYAYSVRMVRDGKV